MRRAALFVVALSLLACSRKLPTDDPAFEARWNHAGEAVVIGDNPALAAVRKVKPQVDQPQARPSGGGLPQAPGGDDVDRIVRGNVNALKGCYYSVARRTGRSGKAIVRFDIGSNGKTSNVQVEAPSFKDTVLPSCLSRQVSFWSFPRSQKGAVAVSYPLVFVGG